MKLNQLSVFLENRPGRLSTPCRALARAGVNIITLSLADTQKFGLLRIIVGDWRRGQAALEAAGCTVNLAEVVAVPVADRPGGLAEVLEIIEQGRLNLEYMYAFTVRAGDKALMVFRFEDPDAAIGLLKSKGIHVVDAVEFYDDLAG
jgi:hypothetical protein